MALTKFKVCPVCGERNPPVLLECGKCETDLTGVKVVDEAILAAANASVDIPADDDDSRGPVKICDCGTANHPQARKCSACGEDLSDVRATECMGNRETRAKAVLRSVDGSFSFVLEKPVTVIGRDAEMRQYLASKSYVSRMHAKFTIVRGDTYIENMSGTNSTFVNNVLIPGGAPTLLKKGDEIGLGGKLINGERQNGAAYLVVEVLT
jgi:ribosomal protein L40E